MQGTRFLLYEVCRLIQIVKESRIFLENLLNKAVFIVIVLSHLYEYISSYHMDIALDTCVVFIFILFQFTFKHVQLELKYHISYILNHESEWPRLVRLH